MARSIWTGSLAFGLVNVPVRLYSATHQRDVPFHQFERGTGRRVRVRRVAEGTDDEVSYGDIVKGHELGDGRWVMIEPGELDAIEPRRSRTIEIEDFVDLGEVDPVQYERTYYLGPDPNRGAERPYQLLLDAMRRAGRVGIARFVMRGKEYLAAVRPMGEALALETMYFPDEVRDPVSEVDGVPTGLEANDREMAVALQLIDSLTVPWEPDRYHDTYRERVLALIESKARGETVELEPEERPAQVVDLMAALEESLRRSGRPAATGGRRPGGADDVTPAEEELAALTVDELQERARRAGLSGRSKMRKEELVQALARAS